MKYFNFEDSDRILPSENRGNLDPARSTASQNSFLRCDSNQTSKSRNRFSKSPLINDTTYLNMFENRKNSNSKSRLSQTNNSKLNILNNDNINMLRSHKNSNAETPKKKNKYSYKDQMQKNKKKLDNKTDNEQYHQIKRIYKPKLVNQDDDDYYGGLTMQDPKLVEKLKDRLKLKDDRIKSLTEANDRTEKLKDNLLKNMQCLYDEINVQHENNTEKDKQIKKLNDLLKNKKEENKKLNNQFDKWESQFQNDSPYGRLSKDDEKRYRALEVINEYISSDDPRDHKIANILEDLESRTNEIGNLKKDLEVYMNEIGHLNKTIEHKNGENLELINKLKTSPSKNQDMKDQTRDLSEKSDQCSKLENHIDSLLKDLDTKDNKIGDLQRELEKQYEKNKTQTPPRKNSKKLEDNDPEGIGKLSKKEIENIINENFELQQQQEQAKKGNVGDSPSDLQKKNKKLQQQLNDAKFKVGEMNQLIEQIKEETAEKEREKYEQLQEDLKNSKDDSKQKKQQESRDLENKRLKNTIADQKKIIRAKSTEVNDLNQIIEDLEKSDDTKNPGIFFFN